MRCHILGAGNMGVLAALYLSDAGHEVIFIREEPAPVERLIHHPAHAAPLERHWPVCAPGDTGPIRFLWLALKGPRTRAAVEPLLPALGAGATLIRFQNGMGTLEGLSLPWHLDRIEAVTFSGAWRRDNEHFVVAENTTLMGNGNAAPPQWFTELQPHWPHLRWEEDIQQHQLMKLAVNAVINPLTALHDCPNGALADDDDLRRKARALAREVDSILKAFRADWPGGTADRSLGVARDTAKNTSSMRSDFRQGRETEIRYINGWLLDRARELGVSAPLNEALVEQILTGRVDPPPGHR